MEVEVKTVALRLSEETASDLWNLIYMYGEHIAAGAPIVDMGEHPSQRLAQIMRSLESQLGRPSMYSLPVPAPDDVL